MSAARFRALPVLATIGFAALLALGCGDKRASETQPPPTPEAPEVEAGEANDVETESDETPTETESPTARATGDPVLVDVVYVIVDRRVITAGEIARRADPVADRILESNPTLDEAEVRASVFAEVARDMVVRAVILKAARDEGLTIDETRVGSEIRQLLVNEGLSLEEYLEKHDMTYRELYQEMHDETLFSAYRQLKILPRVHVAPREVKAYFEANKDGAEFLTPEHVRCHEIVLFGNNDEKWQKATAALEKLRAGTEFAEVAREYSENTETVRTGGDRGWIARNVINSDRVNRALFDQLKVGEASDVIEDENGFLWIVMVSGRREAIRTPLDEAYATIEARLRRMKIQEETRRYAQRLSKKTAIISPNELRQ